MQSMGTDSSRRQQVRGHLIALVQQGTLRRGSRVPSIAELVRQLGVGKNTVIAALDDLCGEGVLEAQPRRGFFVRAAPRPPRARATRIADLRVDAVAHGMATIIAGQAGVVTIGAGTPAESLLRTPAWERTLRRAAPRDPRGLRYADPLGEPRLRDVIAARVGDEASPDLVVVTHGAVEALNHAFAVTAAATGSRRIAIESPGYFMVPSMLTELGLEVVPIPRTQDGLDLQLLRDEARRAPLAAVMINPNHQNPLGDTLPMGQRFELAALAQERRFFLVEDDVYRGLWNRAEEPAPIRALLPERTLYIGSLSKTLGAALRVGFIVAPPALLEPLRRRKFLSTLTGDAHTQELVAEFVETRGYARHLEDVRHELGLRARVAEKQAAAFSRFGRFSGRYAGGLFWRFDFRPGVDAMKLYVAARSQNVIISPGGFFYAEPVGAEAAAWMRVSVSHCEGRTLEQVLRLLADVT